DPDMQKAAQKAVDKWVPRKNKSKKVAAEVLIEPGTGEIRSMAQSRDYGPDESKLGETSINFATDSDRGGSTGFQAGSTFQAFTLAAALEDRKSTRLNSSHVKISYAVFCLKKKKKANTEDTKCKNA